MTTAIEWAEDVWNPVTGCTRVSEGCDHCYIVRTMPFRSTGRKFDGEGPGSTTGVTLHQDRIEKPVSRRKPTRYFVNSLSDLFHEDVPDEFIVECFAVMAATPRHQYLILTKRPGRMASLLSVRESGWSFPSAVRKAVRAEFDAPLWTDPLAAGGWPLRNVWLGTSVENQKWANVRIPQLLRAPAAVRFLSCEPLLGAVDLLGRHAVMGQKDWEERSDAGYLRGLDWIIVGGESGPGARPLNIEWARSLRDQCVAAKVPYFFKQVGGHTPKSGGRLLDGRTWDEFPQTGAA